MESRMPSDVWFNMRSSIAINLIALNLSACASSHSITRVASTKRLPSFSYCLTQDVTEVRSLPHNGCYPY